MTHPPVRAERVTLRGDLVSIRPFEDSDAAALFALRQRNREFFRPTEPSSVVVPSVLADVLNRFGDEKRDWDGDHGFAFAILRSSDDLLVGRIALSNVSRFAWQNAVLGYYVDERHNRKGYATEATRLAVRFGFAHAGLHRIQAGVMTRNRPSIRVLEKAGFRHEGTALRYLEIRDVWEDHEIFAITREEWEDQTE